MKLTPILPRFGAEVKGFDFTRLDEGQLREVQAAIDEHAVLVFRNTGLDDEGHVAFSRYFGQLMLAPRKAGGKYRFARPELFDAGNLDADGNVITDPLLMLHKKGDWLWHTDSSFSESRASYSLLFAHEVPPEGGLTWFADTRSAWDDLPEEEKEELEGLELLHSIWQSRRLGGLPVTEEEVDARPKARQPLVLKHPRTGRKSLYVASHACDVVGIRREEGQALIARLIAHCTQPHYVFSFQWAPGDLVMWDNLASMHRGSDYDIAGARRDLRRTTVYDATHVSDVPGNRLELAPS